MKATSCPTAGNGFFVTPNGHILTNNHVAGARKSISVRLPDRDAVPAHVACADQQGFGGYG